MERTIQVGFAERHFVTQPEQVVACMDEPGVLFCEDTLTLEHLAAWIGRFPPPAPHVFTRWFGAPEPVEDLGEEGALKALREIVQCGKPSKPLPLPFPMLVLAPTIDQVALAALLVIKLRGICQTLALTAPREALDVAGLRTSLVQMAVHPPEQLIAWPDRNLTGFGPVQGLRVISGMTMTVFSTEGDYEQILKRHTELSQKGPLPA